MIQEMALKIKQLEEKLKKTPDKGWNPLFNLNNNNIK